MKSVLQKVNFTAPKLVKELCFSHNGNNSNEADVTPSAKHK